MGLNNSPLNLKQWHFISIPGTLYWTALAADLVHYLWLSRQDLTEMDELVWVGGARVADVNDEFNISIDLVKRTVLMPDTEINAVSYVNWFEILDVSSYSGSHQIGALLNLDRDPGGTGTFYLRDFGLWAKLPD